MFTRRSAVALLMLLAFASRFSVAAQPNEESATLEMVESKLDGIIRKLDGIIRSIDSLEQRLSRLEGSLMSRPGPEIRGTVGPYRIGKHGFLYDEKGNQIGMWGVHGR